MDWNCSNRWWIILLFQTKIIMRFIFFVLLFISSTAYADCDDAFRKCRSECSGVTSLFNYESGKYVNTQGTDFASNCEDSCRRGRRYCESESKLSEGCYEFRRKCRNECPSSIFSYRSSNFLLLTDANSKCEDACNSGYRRCN